MGTHDHLKLDDATLAAARGGDMNACEAIYRRFERPVYNVALRLCTDADEAMDVLQNTFLKAFERLDQFRGDSPFWPWLKRVAVTQSLMKLRRERLHRLWPGQWLESEAVEDGPGGETADLEGALARLPATTRAVVWLYDVEGYSHAEIAELMGKTESFSKSRLARGHARLREWLEPEEEDATCVSMMERT